MHGLLSKMKTNYRKYIFHILLYLFIVYENKNNPFILIIKLNYKLVKDLFIILIPLLYSHRYFIQIYIYMFQCDILFVT